MPDGAGSRADFFHAGRGIFPNPFRQFFRLHRKGREGLDIVEELERFISFQKIRRHCEGVPEPAAVLLQVRSPVLLAGFQEPENAFQVSITFQIVL